MDINNENQSDEVTKFCIADFYESLVKATEEAGGSVNVFRRPEHVTLKDLAELLAPNGVRFTFLPTRSITNVETYQAFRFKNLGTSVPTVRPTSKPTSQGYVHPDDRGMGRP